MPAGNRIHISQMADNFAANAQHYSPGNTVKTVLTARRRLLPCKFRPVWKHIVGWPAERGREDL